MSRIVDVLEAFTAGLGRVAAAPRLVMVVFLANLAVSLPIAIVVGESIRSSLGDSEAGDRLLAGLDMGWLGEYQHDARGLETTVTPSRLADGGWLDNLDSWWSGELFYERPELIALGGVFAVVWLLLQGGLLSNYRRRDRGFINAKFGRDCARFFFRFVRLAALSAPLYYGVFRFARWLFPKIEQANLDVTVEKRVLLTNLLAALLIVVLILAIKLVFDYAKVIMVAEEKRSAVVSASRALAFVGARPLSTLGLVLVFAALGAVLLAARTTVPSGVAAGGPWSIAAVFVLGQIFLLARAYLRLSLIAAQMSFFEES